LAGKLGLEIVPEFLTGLVPRYAREGPGILRNFPPPGLELFPAFLTHFRKDVKKKPLPKIHDLLTGSASYLQIQLDELEKMPSCLCPLREFQPDVWGEAKDLGMHPHRCLFVEDHAAGEVPGPTISGNRGPFRSGTQRVGDRCKDHRQELNEPFFGQEIPARPKHNTRNL
jgi:hypothetical protein